MTDEPKDSNVSAGFMPRISWAMYDFANTIYAFVVMTLAGVRYFDAAGMGGELFYGISFFTSMIVSGIVVPVIGAISDRIGYPKFGVIILTIVAVFSMFLMGLTQNMFMLCIYLFIGNIAFQCSLVLYDSLLPLLIKNNDEAGKVSGLGVGLGYLGSIVSAGLIMILLPNIMFKSVKTQHFVDATEKSYLLEIRDDESKTGKLGKVKFLINKHNDYEILPKSFDFNDIKTAIGKKYEDFSESASEIRIEREGNQFKIYSKSGKFIKLEYGDDKFSDSFILGAILFFLTAIPFVIYVPERRISKIQQMQITHKPALQQVFSTIRKLPKNKPLLYFLLAAFMCQDVQNTAISYLAKITHSVFAPTEQQIIVFLLLVNSAAAIFSFVLGYLADRIGPRTVLIMGAFGTLCALVIAALVPREMFYIMALALIIGGGLGIAAFWTAGRKLLMILAPPEHIGEYFGFLNLTKKFAVIGIIMLPTIKLIAFQYYQFSEASSYRIALIGQLPMLLLGIFFLFLIKMPSENKNFKTKKIPVM